MNLPKGFGRGRDVSAYLIGTVAVLSLGLAGILWVIWVRDVGSADWFFGLAAGATLIAVLAGAAGFCRRVDNPDPETALIEAGAGYRLPDLVARRHAERIGRTGSWYWILESDEIVWSEEAFRILGLESANIVPAWSEFLRLVLPEERDALHEWFRKAWKSDTESAAECRIIRADGTARWVEARLGPLFESGIKTAVFGTLMDVTDRVERLEEIQALNAHQEELVAKRTAELQAEIVKREAVQVELELSEAMHRNIVDGAVEAIVTVDVDGQIISANKAVETIFGYEPSSLVGKPVAVLMERGVAVSHQDLINSYLLTGKSRIVGATTELSAQRANGETFPIELSVNEVTVPGHKFFCAVVRDIGERRAAELELRQSAERLKESERNLKQLLDLSPIGITIVEQQDHNRLYANEAMARMFMIPAGTPLSEWGVAETFADPESLDLVKSTGFATNPVSDLELLRKRRDGSTWWCIHYSRPIVFGGKKAAIVWHLDISSRKKFEAELSRTEEQLRSTISNAPAGILLTDKEINIVVANDELRDIVKVPEEMMDTGKNYADVIRFLAKRGDFGPNPDRSIDDILDTLKAPAERSSEYTSLDGKVFNVRRHPVGGGGAVTIAMDVTEQKEAEERLRQALWDLELTQDELVHSEKMASLGSLVAGVAHEINTPMGTALTAATHVREETLKVVAAFKKNEIKRSQLENFLSIADEGSKIIESNLSRAAHLIRSFKQVAVDQSSEQRRSFNIDSYLRETIESLTPQLRPYPKIELILVVGADVEINSFPGAFSQILSNLLVNALTHAFEHDGSGKIEIRTLTLGDQMRISFEDNGLGMTEAVRGRIFEPFFTTRRGTGGSGLGLHIVYNLVTTKLSGTIRCFSNPGEGTRFDITLPITSETVDD